MTTINSFVTTLYNLLTMENPHSYVIVANYTQNKPSNQFYIAMSVFTASRSYICASNQKQLISGLLVGMFKHK